VTRPFCLSNVQGKRKRREIKAAAYMSCLGIMLFYEISKRIKARWVFLEVEQGMAY